MDEATVLNRFRIVDIHIEELYDRVKALEAQNEALRKALAPYVNKKQIDNSKKLWRR